MIKAVEKAGFQYRDIVFNPLAAADAVLSRDEMELGVALLDIGGGTIDIIVYLEGGVAYSTVLSIGGIHVTNDISIGLRTPIESAELIKKKYGCAVLDLVDPSEMVEVPSVGGRPPRKLLRQELDPDHRAAGGGDDGDGGPRTGRSQARRRCWRRGSCSPAAAACSTGPSRRRRRVFNMPVRIGVPRDIAGSERPGGDAAVRERRGTSEIRAQDEPVQERVKLVPEKGGTFSAGSRSGWRSIYRYDGEGMKPRPHRGI